MNQPEDRTISRPLTASFFAIFLWSLAAPIAHELRAIPVGLLLGLTGCLTCIYTSIQVSLAGRWSAYRGLKLSNCLVGACLLTVTQLSYLMAFRLAPPEEVDLINYLWPLFLIVASCFLPNERWRRSHLASALVGFVAIWILLAKGSLQLQLQSQHLPGYIWAFAAAITWAIYTIHTRMSKGIPSEMVGFYCGFAGICFLVSHFGTGQPWYPLDSKEWSWIGVMAVGTSGVSYMAWQYAVKHGNLQRVGLISYLTPLLSVGWLVLFGKAEFTWYLVLSTCLICGASSLSHLLDYAKRRYTLVRSPS